MNLLAAPKSTNTPILKNQKSIENLSAKLDQIEQKICDLKNEDIEFLVKQYISTFEVLNALLEDRKKIPENELNLRLLRILTIRCDRIAYDLTGSHSSNFNYYTDFEIFVSGVKSTVADKRKYSTLISSLQINLKTKKSLKEFDEVVAQIRKLLLKIPKKSPDLITQGTTIELPAPRESSINSMYFSIEKIKDCNESQIYLHLKPKSGQTVQTEILKLQDDYKLQVGDNMFIKIAQLENSSSKKFKITFENSQGQIIIEKSKVKVNVGFDDIMPKCFEFTIEEVGNQMEISTTVSEFAKSIGYNLSSADIQLVNVIDNILKTQTGFAYSVYLNMGKDNISKDLFLPKQNYNDWDYYLNRDYAIRAISNNLIPSFPKELIPKTFAGVDIDGDLNKLIRLRIVLAVNTPLTCLIRTLQDIHLKPVEFLLSEPLIKKDKNGHEISHRVIAGPQIIDFLKSLDSNPQVKTAFSLLKKGSKDAPTLNETLLNSVYLVPVTLLDHIGLPYEADQKYILISARDWETTESYKGLPKFASASGDIYDIKLGKFESQIQEEAIKVETKQLSEIEQMIRESKITDLFTLLDRAVGGIGKFIDISNKIEQITKDRNTLKSKNLRLENAKQNKRNGTKERRKLESQIPKLKEQLVPQQENIENSKIDLAIILSKDLNLKRFLNIKESGFKKLFHIDDISQIDPARLVDLRLSLLKEKWEILEGNMEISDDQENNYTEPLQINYSIVDQWNYIQNESKMRYGDNVVNKKSDLGYKVVASDEKFDSKNPQMRIPSTVKIAYTGIDLIQEFIENGNFIVNNEYDDELLTVTRKVYPENIKSEYGDEGISVRLDYESYQSIKSPILKKFIDALLSGFNIDKSDKNSFWSLEIILETYDTYLKNEGLERVTKIISHYAKENSLTTTINDF